MRNLDAIAVVDPELRAVVWAARGPWQALHDAQVLDNGNVLLFDNQGLPKGSRVLEYDPRTQAFPWSWSGDLGNSVTAPSARQCVPVGSELARDCGVHD